MQSFNEEFYTCLDVTSNVSVESSVELSIVKLSYAFVNVLVAVHDNCTGSFVCCFDDYVSASA